MSVIQPPYEVPYPIVTDDVTPIYDPRPVAPVEPVAPARPVEGETERPDDATTPQDVAIVSMEARNILQDAAVRNRTPENPVAVAADAYEEALQNRSGVALRELLQSFRNYDNGRAQEDYNHYLNMFTRYGTGEAAAEESDAVSNLRAMENGAYREYGISYAGNASREIREGIGRAIDRWFRGEGVFMPEMLRFGSSDGFRFSPLSRQSQEASRAADIMASYDRSRIAQYLRELAGLTPNDFIFSDPTGLETLSLDRRRELLDRIDRMLLEQDLDIRAAELRYVQNADYTLSIDLANIADAEERQRLQDLTARINTYYGELMSSVEQYNAGVVSDAMA